MTVKFTNRLIAGIRHVSSDCASDALADYDEEEWGCSEAAIMAETALDADRLVTWGYPEAYADMRELVEKHGYPAVLAEAEKHVCY